MDHILKMELKGLRNFGNTCYFNSAIQLLMKLPIFEGNVDCQDNIIILMKKLYDSYRSLEKSADEELHNLYVAVCKEKGYQLGTQQDSCEFMQFMLSKIADFMPNKHEITIVMNQLLKCEGYGSIDGKCNNPYKICVDQKESILISNAINDAEHQNVEIDFKTFLQHALQLSSCELKDYICNCVEPNHVVQTVLTDLPKYLFINVGRGFAFSQKKMNILTIANNFTLSTPIDLKELCDTGNTLYATHTYKLCGIIVHYGFSLNSGHYISYVKNNDDWFICNDGLITEIKNFSHHLHDMQRNTCVLLFIKE